MGFNPNSIGKNPKRGKIFTALRQKRADIIIISDSRISKDIEKIVKAEWGGDCAFASFSSASRGCAIFFKKNLPVDIDFDSLYKSDDGNFISLNIIYEGLHISINCVYGPNDDSPNFYNDTVFPKIKQRLEETDFLVAGGDWNLVMDQGKDTFGYLHENNKEAKKAVKSKMDELGLIDIYRDLCPDTKRYTWRTKKKSARLDCFLISESLLPFVTNADIIPGILSDHSIITMDIDFSKFKRGRGFFKFNSSLCKEIQYVDLVKDTIKRTCQQYAENDYPEFFFDNATPEVLFDLRYSINDQLLLEMLLLEIRGETIKYCATKKKEKQAAKILAMHRLEIAENNSDNQPFSEILKTELENAKIEIDRILTVENEGAFCRSRLQWNLEGEIPTKFFCNLEKKNALQKYIPELIVKNGQGLEEHIKTQDEIDIELTRYYSTLFKKQTTETVGGEVDDFIEGEGENKLTIEMSEKLEGKLTVEECTRYLKNCRNNASPGSSGFTGAFFKMFWKNLSSFTVNSLNYAYEKGELSVTQRHGVIILLPKGTKDKRYLNNWRAISLLNTTYKILSGTLAERLKPTLPFLINKDQKGFVEGRFIGENIRNCYDVLDYAKTNNKAGLLLCLDYEKAFDSIEHSFIIKAFRYFNFGESFISWIKLILNNITSCINHCGNILERFLIERGCRQGCPLSPYIFVVCVELLAIKLRQDVNVKGFKIGSMEHLLDLYADDTNIYLDGSEASLQRVIHILDDFRSLSGLKINLSKSKAIWFGSEINSEVILLPHLGLLWSKTFSLLGLEFDNALLNMKKNIVEKMKVIEKMLNSWLYRNLTPFGKVAVIKSLALSKLSYLALVCPLDSCIEKKMTKMMFDFIWNKKPDKIKRDFAYLPVGMGGLNAPNISDFWKSLKFSWFRRFFTSENIWIHILVENLGIGKDLRDIMYGGPEMIKKMASTIKNAFWKETLAAIAEIQISIQFNKSEKILEFNIFGNYLFKVGNRLIQKGEFIYIWNKKLYQVLNFVEFRDHGLQVLSRQEFNNKYSLNIDFISYHRIESAIRSALRVAAGVQQEDIFEGGPHQPILRNLAFKNIKGCADFYRSIRHKKVLNVGTHSAEMKWAGSLGIFFDIRTWNKIWKMHLQTEYTNKIKWLQLQILRRVLPTNKIVNKFKPEISNNCAYCGEYEETVEHLFWECAIVKQFWTQIYSFIERIVGPKVCLKKKILFGDTDTKGNSLTNIFIIMSKNFIWQRKFSAKTLYVEHFFSYARLFLSDVILKLISLNKFEPISAEWSNTVTQLQIDLEYVKAQRFQ